MAESFGWTTVRQIWALCSPVIPFRFCALRRCFRFLDDMPSLTSLRCAPRLSCAESFRGCAVEAGQSSQKYCLCGFYGLSADRFAHAAAWGYAVDTSNWPRYQPRALD